jgi:stress response protein YsnF
MPMLSEREVSASIGSTAYDTAGGKIGTVDHFFVDDRTGAPTWVAVTTGLFGTKHSIVPAADATFSDGGLRVPVTADAVKSAPHLTGDHLSPEEEDTLRRHYGVGTGGAPPERPVTDRSTTDLDNDLDTGRHAAPDTADQATTELPAAAPPTTGGTRPSNGADGGMTRSEEQLVVGTEKVATTRARLVKYVVTEEVQITVPIRREEIRVEQVPIDAVDEPGESLLEAGSPQEFTGTAGGGGTTGGGLPSEIVLHTERPVVTVEVVPTERVRLRTELVQGQETITEQVQREQIVVDQDMATRGQDTTVVGQDSTVRGQDPTGRGV